MQNHSGEPEHRQLPADNNENAGTQQKHHEEAFQVERFGHASKKHCQDSRCQETDLFHALSDICNRNHSDDNSSVKKKYTIGSAK